MSPYRPLRALGAITRRSAPTLALAGAFALVGPAIAHAAVPTTTAIWGYSGLVVMPTATVHGFRDFSLGLHALSFNGGPRLVPYATAGLFEGLECGVLYGVPVANFSGLSGHAKYQLIKPTRERPTAVAVGLSLIGVNGGDRYVDGNNVYLVLSQDVNASWAHATYTLFSAHFGFAGNLSLGSRLMAGLELPVTDQGSIVADYLGPMNNLGGFVNFGAAWRPVREWQVRLYSMGTPGGAFGDRDYGLGLSYAGNILGNPVEVGNQPGPRPTASPDVGPMTQLPSPGFSATPAPLPSVPPVPSALPLQTPLPRPTASDEATAPGTPAPDGNTASLRGTLLDDRGRPLAGWSVGVSAADRFTTTDARGGYALSLPLGPYDLSVRDPQGKPYLSKAIRLVSPAGMALPLVVSLPVGQIKGTVIDRRGKQGLADATIQLVHAGETYNLTSRDQGAFYLDDLPEGEYRVVVTRSRYVPFEGTITIVAQQAQTLVVPLAPRPGSLSGRVSSLAGQGQSGVSVRIPALKLGVTTDRLGAYLFRDLPPGDYEVVFTQGARTISAARERIRADETTTENVTVAPSAPANRAGTIGGLVSDTASKRPLAGVKIVVEGSDLTVLTISAADGHFTVSDLPPGRYKVTASKGGYHAKLASASVTAKAGATVNLGLAR